VDEPLFSRDDLIRAQKEAALSGTTIGAALLKLGIVEETVWLELLAQQYGVPAVDLRTRRISSEATEKISRDEALNWLAIPIERTGSVMLVAAVDPSNVYAREGIERRTGLAVEMLVASEPAMREAIDLHYPADRPG
jgi:type IV pilus assembly protein PilB